MKKILGMALFLLFFVFCATAMAKAPIDIEYAKVLVQANTYDSEMGYNFVVERLKSLDKEELVQLKEIIKMGWGVDTKGRIRTSSNFMAEVVYSHQILSLIDDLLGNLPYTHVFEGRFKKMTYEASSITYYNFMTKDGLIVQSVIAGSAMLNPSYWYAINYNDDVRIFTRTENITENWSREEILKLELIKDNTSSHDSTLKKEGF